MSESFILYLVLEIGLILLGIYSIKSILLKNESTKIREESKKLQAKINYYQSHVNLEPDSLQNSLGEIGIDGILDSLGLPSIIKPFAKGLIDSYLKNPEKLQSLAKKLGVKIEKEGNNEESHLL